MQNDTEYRAFGRDVNAVISRFLDSLEQFPSQRDYPVPADWSETQALLRGVAEDLMLCRDLDSAVQKMREDKATLMLLVVLTTEVEDAAFLQTLHSAFESQPQKSEALPGQSFATYLLEIAKGKAPIWRTDRDA